MVPTATDISKYDINWSLKYPDIHLFSTIKGDYSKLIRVSYLFVNQ